MLILIYFLTLVFLFVALGFFADLAVKNIKYIASDLNISLFAFGIILGIITSLPELAVGINATIDKAASLSAGNLLGGIIVILGLILGASLCLNRKIKTDGNLKTTIPSAAVIFFPVLLGMDGSYGMIDGLLMVGVYLSLIFYLYQANRRVDVPSIEIVSGGKIFKAVIFSILGIVAVLLASHWIVKITLVLLDYFAIKKFVIGLLVFAIGTNLPEITIAFSSWRKKSPELSLSHLFSSAFSNVLILGVVAILGRVEFIFGLDYWVLSFFLGLILVLFVWFHKSGKKLDRLEGIILLSVYILFLACNLVLLANGF